VLELSEKNVIEYLIISPIFTDYFKNKELTLLLKSEDFEGVDNYYKAILVKKGTFEKIEDLKDKTMAIVSFGQASEQFFNDYILSNIPQTMNKTIEPLWLKKDFDAILALMFQQVDAACISPLSLDFLKKEKPEFMQQLRVINISKSIKLPCLYSLNNKNNPAHIIELFEHMKNTATGEKLLKLMGLSKWLK